MAVWTAHSGRRDGARTGRSVQPGRRELVIERQRILGDLFNEAYSKVSLKKYSPTAAR